MKLRSVSALAAVASAAVLIPLAVYADTGAINCRPLGSPASPASPNTCPSPTPHPTFDFPTLVPVATPSSTPQPSPTPDVAAASSPTVPSTGGAAATR